MGESFDAACTDCGKVSNVRLGGGFTFLLQHCEVCGKPKAVSLREKIEPDDDTFGSCECGGRLSFEAPPRCPNCRSTELEPIDGTYVLYD